jgi:Tol biopolymer transport system component
MTDQSPFEARLTDAYARYVAPVPVEVDARAVAAMVTADSAARPLGWRGVTVPSRRTWVLLAIGLLAVTLAAAALLAGSRPARHLASGGLLVYVLDSDIYLADDDGSNPRKVADGVAWSNGEGGGPSYLLGDGGPAWSPDGRYFLYYDIRGAANDGSGLGTGHIADAGGHVVASIPNIWVDATWSPDSTRIEAWTGGPESGFGTTQISIFGIDGVLQESLSLPAGYIRSRESAGWWTPDGRSVRVRLAQGDGGPPASYWQLPLDGSAPRKLRPVELVPRSISPDGSRMAWSSAGTLFVANADGTDAHADAAISAAASGPIWSPTGRQVAYDADTGNSTREIHVVDIASGTDRIVVPEVQVNGPGLRGWSRAGDRLLFAGIDQQGPSLWSIGADGTDREVVVAGAYDGEWQPGPRP